MDLFKLYKWSGPVSIIVGALAASSLLSIQFIPLGLLLSILGFIFSGINVFLDAKYEFSGAKYPLGYIGMVLSSIPVILLLVFILRSN